jgi:hypothetical protein
MTAAAGTAARRFAIPAADRACRSTQIWSRIAAFGGA